MTFKEGDRVLLSRDSRHFGKDGQIVGVAIITHVYEDESGYEAVDSKGLKNGYMEDDLMLAMPGKLDILKKALIGD